MTKYMKMQIFWASIVFVLILIIGYLGIFALQKSMTIKMSYPVMPNVRCILEIKKTGDTDFTPIFSNLSGSEYIGEGIVLNEQESTLAFQNTFAGGVGAGFELRILNYTAHTILVEATGTGVAYTSVELDAYEDNTLDTTNNTITVATVTNNIVLQFTKVYYAVDVNVYDGIDDDTPETTSYSIYGNTSIPITASTNFSVPSQVNISEGATYSSFKYEPTIEYNANNIATSVWNEAEITITPTSNCEINIYLNPWTYGQYVATDEITDTPSIWAGYYYLQFENSPDKWIIIGESKNIYSNYSNETNPEPASSGLLNTDPDITPVLKDETTSIQITPGTTPLKINGVAQPVDQTPRSPGIKPKTRMFQELIDNQVLLYKETTVLSNQKFNSNNSEGNQWSLNETKSALKTMLNGTYYTETQNLDDYANYISDTELYTVHSESATIVFGATYAPTRKLTKSTEKIFMLSTLAGYTDHYQGDDHPLLSSSGIPGTIGIGASGSGLGVIDETSLGEDISKLRNTNFWERSGQPYTNFGANYDEVFILQNFNMELYLGGFIHASSTSNYKMFYFSSDNRHNGAITLPDDILDVDYNSDNIWVRTGSSSYKSYSFFWERRGCSSECSLNSTYKGSRPAFVLDLAKNYVPVT